VDFLPQKITKLLLSHDPPEMAPLGTTGASFSAACPQAATEGEAVPKVWAVFHTEAGGQVPQRLGPRAASGDPHSASPRGPLTAVWQSWHVVLTP